MVSRRWLLVLWLLPCLQRVQSGFTATRRFSAWKQINQTVPSAGIYIVSSRAHLSCRYCRLNPQLENDRPSRYLFTLYTAFGDSHIVRAEAAVTLKRDDRLSLRILWSKNEDIALSVACVPGLDSNFSTLYCCVETFMSPYSLMPAHHRRVEVLKKLERDDVQRCYNGHVLGESNTISLPKPLLR